MKLTVETNLAIFPYTAFNVNPDGSIKNLENFQPFGTLKYL